MYILDDYKYSKKIKTMKKLLLFGGIALLMIGCGSRSKLKSDIRAYRANIARNASYNMEHKDLYLTLSKVMSNKFTIAKESESKGMIETEAKTSTNEDKSRTTKKYTRAEIVGTSKPYRVEFQSITETQSFVSGQGIKNATSRNRRAEEDLAINLYEQVNGKIELDGTLKKRIESNNNAAKREGQKIFY